MNAAEWISKHFNFLDRFNFKFRISGKNDIIVATYTTFRRLATLFCFAISAVLGITVWSIVADNCREFANEPFFFFFSHGNIATSKDSVKK